MLTTAEGLRRKAAQCAQAAAKATDLDKKEQLIRESESLYALADNEDWLAGRQTPVGDAHDPANAPTRPIVNADDGLAHGAPAADLVR